MGTKMGELTDKEWVEFVIYVYRQHNDESSYRFPSYNS